MGKQQAGKPYNIRLLRAGCNENDCIRIIFARAIQSPSKIAPFWSNFYLFKNPKVVIYKGLVI